MSSVTINGNTYSADGSTPKDMLNGGHRTYFIPLCSDVATVAGQVQNNADQTAIDAVNAADGANAMRGTSTTSTAVGAGSKTFTTQAGKQFTGGNYVTVSRTSAPTTLMHGVVTSYSGTTLTVDVSTIAGSGTHTDWTIALSGAKGNNGPSGTGDLPYVTKTSAYTVLSTDKGKLIDCTSGTFTLSFSACATLGSDWATYIKNSGTGAITLDPNGAELINGAATYTLPPGTAMLLQCDGTTLRTVTVGPTQLIRYKIFDNDTNGMMPASVLEDITPPTFAVGYGSGYASYVIAYGNGLFIAPSTVSQSTIGTSPDGETWTLRTMPSSQVWKVGTNGSNRFIAVCNTTATATSTNGTTWSVGTSLPANAHSTNGTPAYNAGVWCVFGTSGSTNFVSTDDGATWSATQTLPDAHGTRPFVVGGLFWFKPTSGSTAYTSATGLTGSWTARTLPVSPSADYLTMQTNGKLAIAEQVTGADVYETTDGINWTLADYKAGVSGMIPYLLNGVYVTYQATLGRCTTYANGISTLRVSNIDAAHQYQAILAGTRFVAPSLISGGYVISIDTTNMPQTALFTR